MSMSPPLPGLTRPKRDQLPDAPARPIWRAKAAILTSMPSSNWIWLPGIWNSIPECTRILKYPQRELTVHFPVKMDDGETQVFTGYRVQHNVAAAQPRAASATARRPTSTRSARWRCG